MSNILNDIAFWVTGTSVVPSVRYSNNKTPTEKGASGERLCFMQLNFVTLRLIGSYGSGISARQKSADMICP